MNVAWKRLILIGVLSAGIVSCQNSQKEKEQKASWPQKMQAVGQEIGQILPYAYSRKEYHDPKNRQTIQIKLDRFEQVVHGIPAHLGQKLMGKDPIVQYSLSHLKDDVRLAKESFDKGHTEYSRNVLRGSIGHCFRCHSRSELGPEYDNVTPLFGKLRLDPSEKADVFVATRQYDKAISLLESVLKSPSNFYEHPYEQERAIKRYLALVVRVKKDPSRAIHTIDQFLSRKNIPYYLAEDARQWKKSLRSWMHEKGKKPDGFTQAKKLLKGAHKLQEYQTHQAANIEYLRASSLLHDEIRSTSKKVKRAEIYSLLGSSYEVLSDLGFWSLPEIYFEACVRELPGSSLAKGCYKSFERNVLWGFSGSSGIFVPREERERLEKLRKLAGL